ncbi:MAG: Panacea domain-containing protein [Dehalococcoidia bacterium]
MRFVFNAEKTAQAAAYLINRHGGQLNYMVLIKLLYLSDRRSLIETGLPITGDRMVSMDNGPVLSRILNQINMGEPNGNDAPWYRYITEPKNYDIATKTADVPTDELSQYEISVLNDFDDKFGGWDKWRLVEWTHSLPEWHNPHGSMIPISPDEILRAAGKSAEDIEAITADAEEIWYLPRELRRTVG